MRGKLVLLDGYSLMYRAYHGLQVPMTAPDGTPTNAVHGFMLMLIRLIAEEKPDYLVAAFDMHAPTLRAQTYAEYKATRKPMPDELRAQDPVIRELLGCMHIPIFEKAGYEGDDIIGTLTARGEEIGLDSLVITGDRDSFQLVGEHTSILYTKRGTTDTVRVTPEYIREAYGLTPKQLIDVKGLMGDSSDNIPGIAGIGEKTAVKLIGRYGSLEETLAHASEERGKLRERLEGGGDIARLSKQLATIDRNVPLDIDWNALALGRVTDVIPRLRALKLNLVIHRMSEVPGLSAESAIPVPAQDFREVERADSPEAFAARVQALSPGANRVSLYLSSTALSLATDAGEISVGLGGGDLFTPGLTERDALSIAEPLLKAHCPKVVYDLKSLRGYGAEIEGSILDVMLAAYVVDAERTSFDADRLCAEADIGGFDQYPAQALMKLADTLTEALVQNDLMPVYADIELPLASVLCDMEKVGMRLEPAVLEEMGVEIAARIAELVDEIAEMMGKRINLNSPKQLSEVLFVEMGLPKPKKTSRGFSTSAQVLEELAERYPVCERLLEYRKLQKLESTYIRALVPLCDEHGRIHSRFEQVSTATGRISSAEPNLQNIPVRTELGRGIRRAFVASPGCVLVDADYSQIELRVLAHMSGDETLCEAFRLGQDIHTRTAADVYGVPQDRVTKAMRSATKAVNFGIVYGISEFTLAKNIDVSRKEAAEFIERYFARYPGVKRYMDDSVRFGREHGYVTTLLGRRRYLNDLKSSNRQVRAFGERCAMNSPIQGTAADIIKLAMIAVDRALKQRDLAARLVLQVHDELIVEAPVEEADAVAALLRDCMENVIALNVPLKVELSTGGDWSVCK